LRRREARRFSPPWHHRRERSPVIKWPVRRESQRRPVVCEAYWHPSLIPFSNERLSAAAGERRSACAFASETILLISFRDRVLERQVSHRCRRSSFTWDQGSWRGELFESLQFLFQISRHDPKLSLGAVSARSRRSRASGVLLQSSRFAFPLGSAFARAARPVL